MEGGKPENPEKNPRSGKDENQQQTQPTYNAGYGVICGPHWWEASALTTAPSLLPQKNKIVNRYKFTSYAFLLAQALFLVFSSAGLYSL